MYSLFFNNVEVDEEVCIIQSMIDGTNTYLYGPSTGSGFRIAQTQDTTTDYFLSDALGSVRQLTDQSGAITYARTYDPYGVVTQTTGAAQTPYGYTGEYTTNDLVYLRARHYDPGMGRFLTRDTWGGNANSPMSFNAWNYVNGNPVNYIDPSGHIREDINEATAALNIVYELQSYQINIIIDWGYFDQNSGAHISILPPKLALYGLTCGNWQDGKWDLNELYIVKAAVLNLNAAMKNKMSSFIGPVSISKAPTNVCGAARGCTTLGHIELIDNNRIPKVNAGSDLSKYYVVASSKEINFDQWTVVHELGHAWDARYTAQNWYPLWYKFMIYTGGWFLSTEAIGCTDSKLPGCNGWGYHYGGTPPKGSDAYFNPIEDFAESVAAYVFRSEAQAQINSYKGTEYERFLYYDFYANTERWKFINSMINGIIK